MHLINKLVFLIYLIFTGCACVTISAQEMVTVTGSAEIPALDSRKSAPQYEAEVCALARNKAVESEFGTSVLSNYERVMYTEMQGRSVEAYSDVRHDYLNTYPNGIWVRDLDEPVFEQYKQDDEWWMRCTVKGKARAIDAPKVEFMAKTLDGTDPDKNETVDFINGESGYLFFKSPVKGYLILFLDDMEKVYRCLPYVNAEQHQFTLDPNKEYIFFSPEKAWYTENIQQVDEIEFYTLKQAEYNQFFVLFSPVPFGGYFVDSSEALNDGYITPKSMERDKFHDWLQENRIRNSKLQVQQIGITIKKPID